MRGHLQELINEKKGSFYHRYCLFSSFGKGRLVNFDYYRPRIHKTHMMICFDCEIIEPKDLMQNH